MGRPSSFWSVPPHGQTMSEAVQKVVRQLDLLGPFQRLSVPHSFSCTRPDWGAIFSTFSAVKKNARVGIMRVDDPCTVPDGHGRPVFLRRRARTRSPLSSGDRMVAVSISRIAPPVEIRPNKHGIDRRRDCGRCVQKSVGSTLPFSRNKCCLFDVERHSSASTAL